MTSPTQSLQCLICQRRLSGSTCIAFPFGIPPEVIAGVKVCPGGNGVGFKMREGKEPKNKIRRVK